MKRHESAFTLIELSIVLVIIGLIVGGVLAGREMIEAAKVRKQVSQIVEYTQGMYAFKNKYNALPGDLTGVQAAQFGLAARGSTAYTGNGIIDDFSGKVDFYGWRQEPVFFAFDLGDANLVNFKGTYSYPLTLSQVPALPVNPAAGMIGNTYRGSPALCLCVYDGNHSNDTLGTFASQPVVPVASAYAIDSKLDDGIPGTGNVMAVKATSGWPIDNSPSNCVTSSSSTAYNMDTGTNCRLAVLMK